MGPMGQSRKTTAACDTVSKANSRVCVCVCVCVCGCNYIYKCVCVFFGVLAFIWP